MKRLMACVLAASGISAVGVVAIADGAQAATPVCSSGYVCMWRDTDYEGNHLSDADHIYSYKTVSFVDNSDNANDKISSLASSFTRCDVRYYEDINLSGDSILFYYPAKGGTYRDPHLANGGGQSGATTQNWNDRISSHTETDC